MGNEPVSAIILAGGQSTRIGQDKAWLAFDGVPLVLHLARRVLPLAGEVLFSANSSVRYEALTAELPLPVRVVPDLHPGAGPLAGLEACLATCSNDLALLLAVDMPFVSLELLTYMLGQAPGYDAVVPLVTNEATGQPSHEPLHAVYRRTCLPAIARHLAAGHRRMVSFLPDVRVREMPPAELAAYDPAGLSFFNVNTPQDWDRAQRILKSSS